MQSRYNLPFAVKTGGIYSPGSGFEKSVSVEVLQLPKGFSFDLGATKSLLFAGVSKDILSGKYDIDIGAGVTTKKTWYAGFFIKF